MLIGPLEVEVFQDASKHLASPHVRIRNHLSPTVTSSIYVARGDVRSLIESLTEIAEAWNE